MNNQFQNEISNYILKKQKEAGVLNHLCARYISLIAENLQSNKKPDIQVQRSGRKLSRIDNAAKIAQAVVLHYFRKHNLIFSLRSFGADYQDIIDDELKYLLEKKRRYHRSKNKQPKFDNQQVQEYLMNEIQFSETDNFISSLVQSYNEDHYERSQSNESQYRISCVLLSQKNYNEASQLNSKITSYSPISKGSTINPSYSLSLRDNDNTDSDNIHKKRRRKHSKNSYSKQSENSPSYKLTQFKSFNLYKSSDSNMDPIELTFDDEENQNQHPTTKSSNKNRRTEYDFESYEYDYDSSAWPKDHELKLHDLDFSLPSGVHYKKIYHKKKISVKEDQNGTKKSNKLEEAFLSDSSYYQLLPSKEEAEYREKNARQKNSDSDSISLNTSEKGRKKRSNRQIIHETPDSMVGVLHPELFDFEEPDEPKENQPTKEWLKRIPNGLFEKAEEDVAINLLNDEEAIFNLQKKKEQERLTQKNIILQENNNDETKNHHRNHDHSESDKQDQLEVNSRSESHSDSEIHSRSGSHSGSASHSRSGSHSGSASYSGSEAHSRSGSHSGSASHSRSGSHSGSASHSRSGSHSGSESHSRSSSLSQSDDVDDGLDHGISNKFGADDDKSSKGSESERVIDSEQQSLSYLSMSGNLSESVYLSGPDSESESKIRNRSKIENVNKEADNKNNQSSQSHSVFDSSFDISNLNFSQPDPRFIKKDTNQDSDITIDKIESTFIENENSKSELPADKQENKNENDDTKSEVSIEIENSKDDIEPENIIEEEEESSKETTTPVIDNLNQPEKNLESPVDEKLENE